MPRDLTTRYEFNNADNCHCCGIVKAHVCSTCPTTTVHGESRVDSVICDSCRARYGSVHALCNRKCPLHRLGVTPQLLHLWRTVSDNIRTTAPRLTPDDIFSRQVAVATSMARRIIDKALEFHAPKMLRSKNARPTRYR